MSEICEQIVIDLLSGKVDDVKTWIQDNPNVLNQLYKHGDNDQRDTLLNLAAKKGNQEMVKLLLGKGGDPNTIGLDEANALHCSMFSDEIEIVRIILDQGNVEQLINQRDAGGNTPLFLAARNGNTEIVQLLLEKGADARIKNGKQQNSLHIAAIVGNISVVKTIVDHAPKLIKLESNDNKSALHFAIANVHVEVVDFLSEHGAVFDLTHDFKAISIASNKTEYFKEIKQSKNLGYIKSHIKFIDFLLRSCKSCHNTEASEKEECEGILEGYKKQLEGISKQYEADRKNNSLIITPQKNIALPATALLSVTIATTVITISLTI